MNRDDIIRWAREAGFEADESVRDVWATDGYWAEELERFAALVAAVEREACAKVCDEKEAWYWRAFKRGETGTDLRGNPYADGAAQGAFESANAIRARGEK